MRVLLLGATGTIGRATLQALIQQHHDVTCLLRPGRKESGWADASTAFADLSDPEAIRLNAFGGARFDAVVSCLASRTGGKADAWAVDYQAHSNVLSVARAEGVGQMILLSAICVQKPDLPFQQAKLAFEAELQASGLVWSIVRPTAFFKSLSGQIKRVQAGKPYLIFGDGALTACKPISDRDLAAYIVGCLVDSNRQNRVLPIGGPGPALTPLQQGELLFDALGQPAKFRKVPVALMDAIIGLLSLGGRIVPSLAAKAEMARIGRYYATQSMLVLNPETGQYDGDATPSTGQDTLRNHFDAVLRGDAEVDLGDHAVF